MNPAEKSAYDKMIALVTQMLALHKDKVAAHTQSSQDILARQIRVVDESCDERRRAVGCMIPDRVQAKVDTVGKFDFSEMTPENLIIFESISHAQVAKSA